MRLCIFSDINECDSNPCLNDGTCVDQVNGYVCNCRDGYTGVTCQAGKYFIHYRLFSQQSESTASFYKTEIRLFASMSSFYSVIFAF